MINKHFLAFACLHLAVPAIAIALYGANPFWLFGALVFSIAVIRTLHETSSAFVVAILCLLSATAFTFGLALGACYYMQGQGFNDAFFYHLNSASVVIAARSYGNVFYPSLLGLILSFIAPAIIYKARVQKILPMVPTLLLWVLALAGNFPVYSLLSYQAGLPAGTSEAATDMSRSETGVDTAGRTGIQDMLREESGPKKNIILIYAESLEETYFDKKIFGDLLPNISELSANAHRFTNMVQVDGTGWTMAGIVASQCGFPLRVGSNLASNSTMASVEKPFPDQICLADILSESGYETSYMGGAPLWFAGKGNFLRAHGYEHMVGFEDLASLVPDSEYHSGWGYYDDSLFDLALEEIHSLENEGQPYFLTLLTLDTHHPTGLPSRSCIKLPDNKDEMSNSIYCSDQLISGFIRDVMKIVDMDKTVIVLFSDHLSLRNSLWDKLQENEEHRRLAFMIFDNQPPIVSDIPTNHFDVAPTILEAAGFSGQHRIGAGVSLFSLLSSGQDVERVTAEEPGAPSLMNSTASVKDDGILLSRKELSLKIGNLTLKANKEGNKFVSGIFLAVLDEDGNVIDTAYSEGYPQLVRHLNGAFIIGIAVMPRPPYSAKVFYGIVTPDGKGITERYFDSDIYLTADDLWPVEN